MGRMGPMSMRTAERRWRRILPSVASVPPLPFSTSFDPSTQAHAISGTGHLLFLLVLLSVAPAVSPIVRVRLAGWRVAAVGGSVIGVGWRVIDWWLIVVRRWMICGRRRV